MRRLTIATLALSFALTTAPLAFAAPAQGKGKAPRIPREKWQLPDQVLEKLEVQPGMTVGDLGCGDGYFLFRFAPLVGDTGKLYAVDIAEKALKKVEARAAEEKLKNIEIVKSVPNDITLRAASLDLAFICNVLHHVGAEDKAPFLASVHKALKPTGRFVLLDFRMEQPKEHTRPGPEHRYERDKLLKELTGAGFEVENEYDFLPRQWFLVMKKR